MIELITAAEYLAQNARLTRKGKRAHKFGAEAQIVDGIKFPSRWEARRYGVNKLRVAAGEIVNLVLQPKFPLLGKDGSVVAHYVADFQYDEIATVVSGAWVAAKTVVEDAKGVRTRAYILKVKLFKAQYPEFEHRETRQAARRSKKRKLKA